MNDIPHYPWNEGDKLFASELNAAIANAMATSGGAGRNIIDVSEIMRGDPNSGMDATPAMQQALAIAAITPGSVIYLCPGDWNFMSAVPVGPGTAAAINACFLVPSRTIIRGAGMGQTRLFWNDSLCAFNLFDAVQVTTGSPLTFDIAFEEFTIYGSWDTNGDNVNSPPPATGGYPMLLHKVEKIRFTRVGSRFCRANAIATRYCIDVKTLACDIRYCAHGAIDHVSCSMVTVADCTIMHSDDNCIAVHSVHGEPWGVRKNVIIANNSVFDSVGISCVSPRSVLIANNKLDCIRLEGIALHEFTNDAAFDASAMGTVITNNSITNMIDESTITNPPIRVGNAGITISGNSARKGALPAIPGENVTTTTVVNGTTITAGTIIDDTVYFQSNDANTQVAIAVSRGYVIANNYIGRTMPPCDGTATAVGGTLTAGVPKTYNKYSDYGDTDPVGLGYMFLRKGWIDPGNPTPRPGSIVTPPLTVSALSGNGILLNGGSIRDVLITGNQFFGLDAAVTFLLCQPKDVVIRGNHIVDCGTSYGAIMVNLSATLPANEKLPCRVYIEDNFIDVDPYQRHSNRLPKGQWNPNIAPPLVPAALRVQVGSGVVFRNNTVRNAYVMISNQSSGVFESYGNTLEGYATAADSGLSNAGIGVLPLDGSRFRHIESDPTSAHYGELMSIPLTVSLSMPSTGLYIVGTYVAKSYTGPDPNGAVLRGWVRLTTGSSHVTGVDWTPVYDYATSNDLTALPVVGASNGVVVGIAFNGPPGAYQFALSDPYPSVVIDPPGTGGTQAVAHINRLACEVASPFTSSSTAIDHNLGSVQVIPNGGVLYAVGETLTAVGGTFTQAVKGTVQAIGILGDVTSFGIIQLGQYSAYPPDPTTWSGSAVGQGFTTHLQLWSTAGNPIVDNGGYYPNGTPNAIITPTNGDRGGRVTVKMGQSFVGSPTGLMLAGNATVPLQAVPLQQLTSATAGGPFLPLATGGTVTGPLIIDADLIPISGSAFGSLLDCEVSTSGTIAAPIGFQNWYKFDINVDNANIPQTSGASGFSIYHRYGGSSFGGNRNGLNVQLIQDGPATGGTGTAAAQIINYSNGNRGGTGTTLATAKGGTWGISSYAKLYSGATNYYIVNNEEKDIAIQAGASAAAKIGLAIVLLSDDAVQGSLIDTAFSVGNQVAASPGWAKGISFGRPEGSWPVAVDGDIFGTYRGGTKRMAAVNGINFTDVNFTGNAFASPGWSVSGAAVMSIGGLVVTPSPTSVAVDTILYSVTSSVVVGGGSGWVVGYSLYDNYGNHWVAATVGGGTAVLTVTLVSAGSVTSPPSNPVTVHDLTGSLTATLNLTWAAATTLALQPSGGATTVGGALTITGIPTAPTAAPGTSTTQLATTAFAAAAAAAAGVQTFNTRTGAVTLSNGDVVAVLPGSSTAPLMNGVAAVGTLGTWAHADHVHASDTSRVPLTGTSMTGFLTLNADPTNNLHAATKQYVDNTTFDFVRTNADSGFDLNTISGSGPSGPFTGFQGIYSVINQTAGVNFPTGAVTGTVINTYNSNAGWNNQVFLGSGAWLRWSTTPGTYNAWQKIMTDAGGTFVANVTFSSATTHTGAATFNGGVSFGNVAGSSTVDLSKHIALFSTNFGVNVTSNTLNLVANGVATMQLTSAGATVNGTLTITSAIAVPIKSVTATAYTVLITDATLLLAPTATCTLSLLTPSTYPGRYLRLKLTTAFAVVSGFSNVVPLAGGAATNAILPATAGKFALLQSDGTSWQIMEAN